MSCIKEDLAENLSTLFNDNVEDIVKFIIDYGELNTNDVFKLCGLTEDMLDKRMHDLMNFKPIKPNK